ncbi:MAG TPA: OsmC family protein [Gemmatimonadales bacterium]|nr:OsmC family protein [Gemmatimonadales bacterium]
MPTSKATAMWDGKLKDGKGKFTAASGAFQGPYTFKTRFEGAPGTNPEELLAAADAACFSMALSGALEKNGTPATSIETTAACTIEMIDGGPKITKMDLTVKGKVPGIDQATFAKLANETKSGCPVSRALAGIPGFSVSATLG